MPPGRSTAAAEVLAGPGRDGEEVLFADLDLDEIARGRFDFGVAGYYAGSDVSG